MTPEERGPPRLLHEFLRDSARTHAQRVAIDVPRGHGREARRTTSYAELDRLSDAVAASLAPLVRGECVVAILAGRGAPDLFAAQIGVLKAGAAYVCIDPSFPDDHARFLLADSKAVACLTDGAHRARATTLCVDGAATPVVCIDAPQPDAAPPGVAPPGAPTAGPSWLTPRSLAYVIYTSGTTGRPKGVAVEHAAIVNLIASDIGAFDLTPGDRVAQGSSPSYDSSVEETWLALAVGAAVVVMDGDAARLGPDLPAWLRAERITVLCPTPTLLRSTACRDPEVELPDLRLVYAGGEALPADLADRWARGRRFVNGYGPTECAVTALRGPVVPGAPVSIGRPVAGNAAHVLDATLGDVDDGATGELCIGGAGLARGYLDRPELTAERFPAHPRHGRIYRTGDLVRRDAAGDFHYLGRIDAQVKVRGHRIELEEVEARLVQCAGVREAACRVQAERDAHAEPDGTTADTLCLAAHVVASDADAPPSPAVLRDALSRALPAHMVPDRIRVADALPRTAGGKLDRRALPHVAAAPHVNGDRVAPRDALEARIAESIRDALSLSATPSTDADFFLDLGGNSLRAAVVVSALRLHAVTAMLTVRDVYEARTVRALATRARGRGAAPAPPPERAAGAAEPASRPVLVTLAQSAVIVAQGGGAAIIACLLAFELLPRVVQQLGVTTLLITWPLLLLVILIVHACVTVAATVAAKRLLIGRYRPARVPVWSGPYLRHWIVRQCAATVPWNFLRDTVLLDAALRLLGARIGRRVHIHRGVDVSRGGWDLLEIGDDVTVCQDAALRLTDLDDGHLVIGPVTLGAGCTIDIRAGVGAHAVVGERAMLTPLTWLAGGARVPDGELWDGVPARRVGDAPEPPEIPTGGVRLGPVSFGILAVGLRHLRATLPGALAVAVVAALGVRIAGVGADDAARWSASPSAGPAELAAALAALIAVKPIALLASAAFVRLLGRVEPGVIARTSPEYLRVLAKTDSVRTAGEALSGTLFWPLWLRLAGMRIGRRCEISTILDVVPELVEIGDECFLADGIYLGGPRVHRGAVTLAATRLGEGTFLGNHVVVPCGTALPGPVLIGVCTVADAARMRTGTDWFGHPPMELPRRDVVAADRSTTLEPGPARRATRIFWESLRFGLPLVPAVALLAWWRALTAAAATYGTATLLCVVVPAAGAAVALALCSFVLVLKWALLGRVRPGAHPLWSCWCSRWDFHYVAWQVCARPFLARLDGTLLLSVYLRAMGSKIGRRVVLGDGFAHVVDPDMLRFEDGATVACLFQAHSFEDRVLKIDHVRVGKGATLGVGAVMFYGADVGDGASVAPHSVVMKHEHLPQGRTYAGVPVVDAA